jgi:hypothetical protein
VERLQRSSHDDAGLALRPLRRRIIKPVMP